MMKHWQKIINGKNFIVADNAMHLKNIAFNFSNDECSVIMKNDTALYTINFGAGKWKAGETNLHGPSLTAAGIENTSMLYPAKINGSYTWKDAHTLELVLRYIETPHTETYTCTFNDKKLTIEAARSFDYGKVKTTIEATMQ